MMMYINIWAHRRNSTFLSDPRWEIPQKSNEMQSLCPFCFSKPLLQLREEEREAEVAAS